MKPLLKLVPKKVTHFPKLDRNHLHPRIPREEYPVCPRCKTNKWVVFMDANFICLKPKDDKWGGKKERGNKCWYHINDHKLRQVKVTSCHICGSDDIYPGRSLCKMHYIERQKEINRRGKEKLKLLKLQKSENMKRIAAL